MIDSLPNSLKRTSSEAAKKGQPFTCPPLADSLRCSQKAGSLKMSLRSFKSLFCFVLRCSAA
jgi:hypothetical protein